MKKLFKTFTIINASIIGIILFCYLIASFIRWNFGHLDFNFTWGEFRVLLLCEIFLCLCIKGLPSVFGGGEND